MPHFVDAYSSISDEELETTIWILSVTDRARETMVIGTLRARDLKVQYRKVRDNLRRVDPVGRALRRRYLIHRREYNVAAPNCLCHIDGNHKLIEPWRIVVHERIDGYSRLIVYLSASSNNRAQIVLDLFLESANHYGLTSRVRSDRELENIEVGRYMLRARGVGRGSIITGKSVHYQRIERLWRDVHQAVLDMLRGIFLRLEDYQLFEPGNELYLCILHYIYVPRIKKALRIFKSMEPSCITN
jgi:hypothetical protein